MSPLHSKLINDAYLFYEALAALEQSTQANLYQFVLSQPLLVYLQNLESLAAQSHFMGLQQVCELTVQRLRWLDSKPVAEDQLQALERWPRLVSDCLFWPTDEESLKRLITYLQEEWWSIPLTADQALQLFILLKNPDLNPDIKAHEEILEGSISSVETDSSLSIVRYPLSTIDYPLSTDDNMANTTESELFKSATAEEISAPVEEEIMEGELIDEIDEEWQTSQSFTPMEELPQDFTMADLLDTSPLPFDNEGSTTDLLPVLADNELEKLLDETTFDTFSFNDSMEESQTLSDTTSTEETEWVAESALEEDLETTLETDLSSPLPELPVAALNLQEASKYIDSASSATAEASETNDDTTYKAASRSQTLTVSSHSNQLSVAAQHSRVLAELSNKVVEISEALSTELNQFVTAEEESETFLASVEHYTNSIHTLWEAAEKHNLKGFQDVCTFINDNIFEASSLTHFQKLELRELFALWPKLLLDYLQSPTKGATLLIEHLSASAWPLPLSEHQANGLLVQLVQEAVMPQLGELETQAFTTSHIATATPTVTVASESCKKPSVSAPVPNLHPVTSHSSESSSRLPALPFLEEEEAPVTLDHLAVTMPDWGEAFIEDNVLLASEQSNEEELLWMPSEWQEVVAQRSPAPASLPSKHQLTSSQSAGETVTHQKKFQTITLPAFEDDLLMELDMEAERHNQGSLPELFDDVFGDEQMLSNLEESSVTSFQEMDNLIGEVAESGFDNFRKTVKSSFDSVTEMESDSLSETLIWPETDDFSEPLSPPPSNLPLSNVSQDFQLASPHVLDLLKVEISEAQRDLSKALSRLTSAEEDSADLLEAIEQYNDNVQSIAEAAKKTGLQGLQEVCAFVNDNMFELSTHARIIRRTAQSHIDGWPRLVLAYLYNPLIGAQDLIAHLRNPIWPYALDENRSQVLLSHLTGGTLGGKEEAVSETVAPLATEPQAKPFSTIEIIFEELDSPTTSKAEISPSTLDRIENLSQLAEIETDFHSFPAELENSSEKSIEMATVTLVAPDVLDLLMGQISDVQDSLSQPLDLLVTSPDGHTDLLTAVETYTENVQAIWEVADLAKLEGLQEICTFLNENVTTLASQDQASRLAAREVFDAWPTLIIAYLQHPVQALAPLVKHLQNPNWPSPLGKTQAKVLQQHLLPASVMGSEEPHKPSVSQKSTVSEKAETSSIHYPLSTIHYPLKLAPPDVLDLLIGQVTDLEETLVGTLQLLCGAADGSETILTAVGTYTETVQAIWDAADMAKLEGLQEVCTFVNDNITALASQDASNRYTAQDLFATWPSLTMAYLRHPAQETATLIEHLQNPKWPQPLDQTAATTLQQRLFPQQAALTPGPSPKERGESGVSSAREQELETAKNIFLASPDFLEVVCGQIIDTIDSLSAALEVCVTMDSTNPAFLEAIENYTNQVQAIYDAAEMAGLVGLQEVCTFINDNLMAFGTQEPTARRVAQPYFEKWPAAVLDYLQAPLTGSHSLVEMMQARVWPVPLVEDQALHLLSLLTRSSTTSEPEGGVEALAGEDDGVEAGGVEALAGEEEADEDGTSPGDIGMEVNQEISLGSAEVLGILTEELESAKEPLAKELQRFTTLNNQDATFSEAAENYADQIQRLYAAAEMLGLQGLQGVCTFLIDNVKLLSKRDLAARTKAKKVLEAWPDLVLAYLNSPMDSVIPMLNHLREPQWTQPLTDDKAHELLILLTQPVSGEGTIDEEPAYSRPTEAKPEEVSLQIAGDVNRELLAAYLQEVPQHATDFSAIIQRIIRDPQTSDIQQAQRIAHTLKGSSRILGIVGIANVAHHLEDTLEYLAQHKVVLPKELTNTMVEAADCIEQMVDALMGQGEAPPEALQVLQSVLDWANRIDKGNLQASPVPSRPTPAPAPTKVTPVAEKTPAAAEKSTEAAPAGDAGTPEQVLRVPTKTVDNLMRLVGELSISLGQIQERMKHVLQSTRVLTEHDLILQQKTFALENLVDVRGVTGIMQNRYTQVSQDEDAFDALEFEEYNELHSVAHSFIESIADNRELAMSIRNDLTELETMFIHQQRLNKEFEASVMTTRMVPVNTILSKLQRNVRQTCRTTNKKAELDVSGSDILIDSDVLNNLGDPLQHILRNAIDHGIESPDERVLLGKPEAGHIHLSFYREGNNAVVKCQDDGQGLNYTNIRYTAIQRGLLKETQEVTEPELARMILMSGFSTKSGVTQVSGRGVGMDVVHTNIRQMKGTLDLISQTGKGMTLLIKLPMTLVTVHVLLVRVGPRIYGIPTNSLEQVLAHGVGEYQKVGGDITFKMGKNFYAIKALSLLLNEPGDRGVVEEEDPRPVILVHEETGVVAVVVDELIDTHDLVMKSMGQYLKHIHGVAGAAILGDGSVVPLLDLPELLRSPMQAAMTSSLAAEAAGGAAQVTAPSGIPHILIVDDSLSVRKSLSLLIEEAGFETLLAKDGLEAIEVMNQKRPNLMLVDMEMPRMNGLELTAHVRANQSTQKLPIFMITSRTTEKHREQAKTAGVNAYLTKPYQDTELLGLIDKALAGKM